jgi:hypothetical protein
VPCGAEFGQDDPQRNQAKSAQALDREQKTEEFPANKVCKRRWKRHAQQEAHLRRIKSAGISLRHASNLSCEAQLVKVKLELDLCK